MGFHHRQPPARIVALGGPVTRALAVMRAAEPETDRTRLRALRKAIADRIEADIALLDALSGDVDLEDGHDAEGGTDDNGLADEGGKAEQLGCVWFGSRDELSSVDGSPLCWVAEMLVSEAFA